MNERTADHFSTEEAPALPGPEITPPRKSGRGTWIVVIVFVVVLATTAVGVMVASGGGPVPTKLLVDLDDPINGLVSVDFDDGVEPFEVGENEFGRYDTVDGTYRVTLKQTESLSTSLGEFSRPAFAAGVTVDVAEMSDGVTVGVMCLGQAGDDPDALVGYGFFVSPNGRYMLGRQEPDGGIDVLRSGREPAIGTIARVSILCAPDFDGSVDVMGFANGSMIVDARDRHGYDTYVYAGVSAWARTVGAEARFASVSGRVPDEDWKP
jgi:hypothetical protein